MLNKKGQGISINVVSAYYHDHLFVPWERREETLHILKNFSEFIKKKWEKMKTKNISVNIKKNKKVPFKETYLVFNKQKDKVRIVQKFIDETKNQSITFNFNECERLINLLNFYLFNGKFEPFKDKMLIFEKD